MRCSDFSKNKEQSKAWKNKKILILLFKTSYFHAQFTDESST